jgi:hypothetical protein
MQDLEWPVVLWVVGILATVGLAVGISSYVTWSRRWPGMIAGFDRNRCSDVDGLTRWVGIAGMMIGGAFLLAAAAFMIPPFRIAAIIAVVLVSLAAPIVTTATCRRFTRR